MYCNGSLNSDNLPFLTELRRGVLIAVPVMIGYIPFGMLLGAQAAQKEFSATALITMTGINFAGGSEFAAIALWSLSPPVLTIVLVTLLINSRHILMGASLAPHLAHLPVRRALPALFFMCDETWALVMADAAKRQAKGISPTLTLGFYCGVSAALWIAWVFSTGLGVMAGPILGDITRWGLDMAFPAVFFVLLRGMWKGFRAALPWLVSLICSVATYQLFPGAAYVPAGAISGLVAILLMSKKA